MRRLYFLVPDVELTSDIVDALLVARVPESRIHVVAREGTPLGNLPEAGLAQKSDLIPAIERGIGLGGATGTVAGLIAIAIPGGAVISAGALVLALALAGGTAGAWISSMVGVSVDSPRLKPFEQAIARGELLMMVDVPKERVAEIEHTVCALHPQARPEGIEPDIPAFP
jgi:hypothetical protein